MEQTAHQVFQFSVPKLPDTVLAVGMGEVLAVTDLPTLTPLPLASPFVLGLSEWQDKLVTVLDLATALVPPDPTPGNGSRGARYQADAQQYLVAQVIVEAHRELVAWPVQPGAGGCAVPSQAGRADTPPLLSPALIYATITLDGTPLVLLDLERLGSYDTRLQTFKSDSGTAYAGL